MVNLRFGYNLLIISILLVCLWFTYVSINGKAYYKRVFRWLMWTGVMMYVTRLFEIAMDEGYLGNNEFVLNL